MDSYTQKRQATSDADHQSASRMMAETAPPPKQGGTKLESVTLRPTENGGVIVTCSKRPISDNEPSPGWASKDYAFTSVDEALAFAGQEFGATAPAVAPEVM